jgi:CheY-like chemotaxis protein
VVFCPQCNARYQVARHLLESDRLVLMCGACGHVAPAGSLPASAEPGASGSQVDARVDMADGPRVIVGHEVPAVARTLAALLKQAGMAPVLVKSGEQVLQACDAALPARPDAVVLDVGIPGVLAFEVIEQLRSAPATRSLPIILLASVFERTRYKRAPSNLYGADSYLELHHVPDRLVVVLSSLLNRVPAPDDRLQAPVERARAASLRTQPVADETEAAHALARRLLSDVVLYNGDEVAAGIRRGEPFLELGGPIEAALELFLAHCKARAVFDQELGALRLRLLERDRHPDVRPGAADA